MDLQLVGPLCFVVLSKVVRAVLVPTGEHRHQDLLFDSSVGVRGLRAVSFDRLGRHGLVVGHCEAVRTIPVVHRVLYWQLLRSSSRKPLLSHSQKLHHHFVLRILLALGFAALQIKVLHLICEVMLVGIDSLSVQRHLVLQVRQVILLSC